MKHVSSQEGWRDGLYMLGGPRVSGGKEHLGAVCGSEIPGGVGADPDILALRYSKLKAGRPRGQRPKNLSCFRDCASSPVTESVKTHETRRHRQSPCHGWLEPFTTLLLVAWTDLHHSSGQGCLLPQSSEPPGPGPPTV